MDKNLVLQPKDTVFVPPAPKVFVTGEVRNPGAYGWFPGMTKLDEAVKPGDTVVVRRRLF